jgi:hypothetical protein
MMGRRIGRTAFDRLMRQEAGMCFRPAALGLLVLALSTSARSAPLPGDASAADAPAPPAVPLKGSTPAPNAGSTPTKPTAAQLNQPGAIAVPSPNSRNTGTTVASPDPAIFGHLNLFGKARPLEQPPDMQAAPDQPAKGNGAGDAGAKGPEPK